MGETAHILSVVVVSPGDVQAERDCLPAVIEEINRDIARDQGLRLEFVGWEKDTYPGMHPAGPQGLIDPILRVEDCDVLIGILWKRFGTLTLEAQSGTEHEFRRAYAAWQQHQRPHIMMYFNQKRHKHGTQTSRSNGGKYAPSSSISLKRHWRGITTARRSLSVWCAAISRSSCATSRCSPRRCSMPI